MISMEKFTLKNLREALPKYDITIDDQRARVLVNGDDISKYTIQTCFSEIKDMHDNKEIVCEFLIANGFTSYDGKHYTNYHFFVDMSSIGFRLFNCKLKFSIYYNSSNLIDYLKKELDVDSRNKIAFHDL